MGSTVSQFNDNIKINLDQWQQITKTPTMTLMRNKNTLQEAELHNVILKQTQNFNQEMRIYLKRKNIQEAIVKVYGVKIQQSNTSFICKDRVFLKVLIERMPLKFTQIPKLSFPQILYFLIETLKAFKAIYKQIGMFQINRNMIGINNKKQIKVWANQNFAINHPSGYIPIPQTLDSQEVFSRQQYRNIFIKAMKNQGKMIARILQLIQDKYQLRSFPEDFSTIVQNNSNSFDQILGVIQKYQIDRNIQIPKKLQINLQHVCQNKRVEAGPMKSFKQLRKNQNKELKAIYTKRQNIYLHETDYFMETLPLKENERIEKNAQTERFLHINTAMNPTYLLTDRNQNKNNNRDTESITSKYYNYSPLTLRIKTNSQNNRKSSTPHQTKRIFESQPKVLSPSLFNNQNKSQRVSQNNSKNKTSNKKSVSKDKKELQKKLSAPNTGNNQSCVRHSINSPFIAKQKYEQKNLRVNWNKQSSFINCNNKSLNSAQTNKKDCFNSYFKKEYVKEQIQDRRSISHDIMNLKKALHFNPI